MSKGLPTLLRELQQAAHLGDGRRVQTTLSALGQNSGWAGDVAAFIARLSTSDAAFVDNVVNPPPPPGISSFATGQVSGPTLPPLPPTWVLTKTGGVDGTYDASAYTAESFPLTITVQFKIVSALYAHIVGLSADNPDANYTGIDFGLLNDVGTMYKAENSVLTSLGATVAGDIWKVTRTMPSGAVVDTSAGTSTAKLIVDSSIRAASNTISGVQVYDAFLRQPVTWLLTAATATKE